MKKVFFLLVAVIAATSAVNAQDMTATTKDGRTVTLKANGTWAFVQVPENRIPEGSNFLKPVEATNKVVNRTGQIAVWYDSGLWTVEKLEGESAEYQFALKSGDVYARLITERLSVPIPLLRKTIETNALKVCEEFTAIEESKIVVNGREVFLLKARVSMQGIEYIFCWYYFSNSSGTTQLFSYTSESIFDEEREAILDLMNGLEISVPK